MHLKRIYQSVNELPIGPFRCQYENQAVRNMAAKNKMATTFQCKVLQNLDWDEDKFEQIIGGMQGEGNATASSR